MWKEKCVKPQDRRGAVGDLPGGLRGLEFSLRTKRRSGFSLDKTTINQKKRIGRVAVSKLWHYNRPPGRQIRSVRELILGAYNDNILILLSIFAFISLGLGLYQKFAVQQADNKQHTQWVDSVTTIVVLAIAVLVGAVNDWGKEMQFVQLNKKSNEAKKTPIGAAMLHLGFDPDCTLDPFIISGSEVLEGVGTFLVTTVGIYSSFSDALRSFHAESRPTLLQLKLNDISEGIAKLGGSVAVLFIILFLKWLVNPRGNDTTSFEKGQKFLQIVLLAVAVSVLAFLLGLPLAVDFAVATATTRMLKQNKFVRVKNIMEIGLTQNKMVVVAATLGASPPHAHTETPISDFATKIPSHIKPIILHSIVVNSTAFETEQNGVKTFIGNETETALLWFSCNYLGMGPLAEERSGVHKYIVSAIKRPDGNYQSEARMTPEDENAVNSITTAFSGRSLQTIGFTYRDLIIWPSENSSSMGTVGNMVWIGLFGIQDPLQADAVKAITALQKTAIFVRMITRENLLATMFMAGECGIYVPSGICMEGQNFRQLSRSQQYEILPRLQVLARCTSDDKRLVVKSLKEVGEAVGIVGYGTDDGPVLKSADVAFSIAAGTEAAKGISSIVILDNAVYSSTTAIKWGRAVTGVVKRCLQLQLTMITASILVTFVSVVAYDAGASTLFVAQILWICFIMNTISALIEYAANIQPTQVRPTRFNCINSILISYTFSTGRSANLIASARNWYFLGLNLLLIGEQIAIVFISGRAFSVERLSGPQWGASIVLGLLSIPLVVVPSIIAGALLWVELVERRA
ncbi:hypothetical protein BDD12DRAFT_917198 [Trichophaea hybrida]|nr:hypothetical protein BDD12DRAFT_917198 [Trichophaea hybrida]